MKAGLFLYYGKIKVHGLENVPKNKPVIFLPNHQSALIDVLLIAVDSNRKPYFLTRSDVFNGGFLQSVFEFFQMIPIYRIRDGRESLKNNQAVFDTCANLLNKNNAILMFPEANHNVKRRVRPLSKGFTRILFNALDSNENLEVNLVPVGINYRDSISFPDKTALYFGKPIQTRALYNPSDIRSSVDKIKEIVATSLKSLTVHIDDDSKYDLISSKLNTMQVDYLYPEAVNKTIDQLDTDSLDLPRIERKGIGSKLASIVFRILNLPIVLLWKYSVKPKVWEPEFTGTLRFGFAMLVYPVYYALLFTALTLTVSLAAAIGTIFILILFNWLYVRLN